MSAADQESYWNLTAAARPYAGLAGTAQADVVIVGAGIVGLTLADRLQQAGRSVAVVEALTVGAQATGRSTAKLTALHGLLYSKLVGLHGEQVARDYARANQEALEYVVQRAAEGGIDCSLERAPAYTYSASGESLGAIRREAEAARQAGLPVEFVEQAPLPFPIAGAVRLADQVQFHPRKYLVGLARLVADSGAQVYEGTRALAVHEGNPCRVVTDRGSITAAQVVVASHLPFLDRGLFFAKAFPRQHVALAARIPGEKAPGGMFYCADRDGVSVRAHHDPSGPVLIATDRGARPGHGDSEQRYQRLANRVSEAYGAGEVLNRWSNEDYDSMDGLPFVGRMPGMEHVYLATGFGGWGLSNGTAAGNLLADLLLGNRNPLATSWRAGRWDLRHGGKALLSANLHSASEMIRDRMQALKAPPASELARGEGGIVRLNGRIAAAYRDESGALMAFSPYCTHLRCVLAWNAADRLWECPCHGSRFDTQGRMVHGPALHDLRRLE